VTHDLAYAYEARDHVVTEKQDVVLAFNKYRHASKLQIRAFADMARSAIYGSSQSLYGKITQLHSLCSQLDRAWRNV
jgi:hypothetical protein